jgi:thiol-disulfide isomerase/thioredoxin
MALIVLIFAGVQWIKAMPLVRGAAPALDAPLIGGASSQGPVDLAGLRGQPVLVHFWATWCSVCRLGEDAIDRIAADHRVIGVALASGDAPSLQRYLDGQGLGYPNIADPDGEIADRWGVTGVPTSFVIDGSGAIRFARVGYTTGWGLRARLWLAGLLDSGTG